MNNYNRNILITPLFVIALITLVINDHLLKAAYPGWLTGKLSDFVGLFVLAVFVYAIAGKYLESSKRLLTMHIIIGLGFVIWKAAPIEIIFAELNKFVSIPLPSRVKDVSDLIALLILPISYLYIARNRRLTFKPVFPARLNRAFTTCVLAITGLAIIATSPGRRYDLRPNVSAETTCQYSDILSIFEQTLSEKEIKILDKHAVDDTTYRYKIDFKDKNPAGSQIEEKPDNWYVSFITLVYSPSNKQIAVQSIYGWVTEAMPEDNELNQFYMDKLLDPFLKNIHDLPGTETD
jgi:hypothetical protein